MRRGGVTRDSPRGQRLRGAGTTDQAQRHPTAATENKREGGPGRTKGVSAAVAAAAGTLDKSLWARGEVLPLRIPESCSRG